jgi:hypothetical protein
MKSLLLVAAMASLAHADPVSLGWNLRSLAPASVVRVDTVAGTFVDQGTRGETYVSALTLSYRMTPTFAPLVRAAAISNDPAMGPRTDAISNPVVGFIWGAPMPTGAWKVAAYGLLALPLGSGGGNDGDPARLAAQKAAATARSSMDNSMFSVNDLTPTVGLDVAYVAHGLTLQAEGTLFELIRVRGEAVQPDAYKTNFTTGLHAGFFLASWLCVSGELRYQRFLTTPAAVVMNPAARDNLTAAGGLRFLWKLSGTVFRPGVSFARGLDKPLSARDYSIFQLDLPFAF